MQKIKEFIFDLFLDKCSGCFILTILYIIWMIINVFCWRYAINTWLVYLQKPHCILFWQAVLISFIPGLGQTAMLVAAFTWILMLFLI